MVDLHCHILPGLDDGAPDLETSLAMARIAERDGTRVIVATPHATGDDAGPEPALIRERVASLREAVRSAGIGVTVLPGAEYEASDTLADLARSGDLVTLADRGRHVLLEVPFTGQTSFVEHVAFALQLAGLTPILAHPERCQIARERAGAIASLSARGCLIQVNAGSLVGRHGRAARAVARQLLKAGLVDIVASDAHDALRRAPGLRPCLPQLRRFGGQETFVRLTAETPSRIVDGLP